MKDKPYNKKNISISALLLITASSFILYAYSTGITGVTKKNGTGCDCHYASQSDDVIVTINGPDKLLPNETAEYSVTIIDGPLVRGGTNIAASAGALIPGEGMQKIGDELTHVLPKEPDGDMVIFSFTYTAPGDEGSVTLFANGNSVNFNGQNTGDQWNFAENKIIEVSATELPVELSQFTSSVSENNITLRWTTASEINNHGFEIQRMYALEAMGRNDIWSTISFVKGKGSSAEQNEYYYTDKNLSAGKYKYRLKQVDYDGSFSTYDLNNEIEIKAQAFLLKQNYPNPFNPSTRISFSIARAGNVELAVYDVLGSQIITLEDGFKESGSYNYEFNSVSASGKTLSSGIYYYSLKVISPENNSILYKEFKKMILLK